jgi:undecaprenyl-diphosphatase
VLFQAALVLVAGAFALLTFLVKTRSSFTLDLQITKVIQSLDAPLFAWLMNLVSWPGFSPQAMIVTGLIVLLLYSFGLRWEALTALTTALSSTALNVLVKSLVQRPRPLPDMVTVLATLNSYSFPSGHVMFYVSFFGFIGLLAYSLLKPSFQRSLLLIFFGALVVLIGISRVYLGQHWASDVLGAYLLGCLTLVANIQLYRWGKTRFFVQQPITAGKTASQKEIA